MRLTEQLRMSTYITRLVRNMAAVFEQEDFNENRNYHISLALVTSHQVGYVETEKILQSISSEMILYVPGTMNSRGALRLNLRTRDINISSK